MGLRQSGGYSQSAPDLRARVDAARVSSEHDDDFRLRLSDAGKAFQDGRLAAAEVQYRLAIARQPHLALPHRLLGRSLAREERWGLAGSAMLDAIALGDVAADAVTEATTIAARFGRTEPHRFVAQSMAYWSAQQGAAVSGLAAPLLSADVHCLARFMLGHNLPGDDCFDAQLEDATVMDVLCRLARRPDFQTNNADALAVLIETGRLP